MHVGSLLLKNVNQSKEAKLIYVIIVCSWAHNRKIENKLS